MGKERVIQVQEEQSPVQVKPKGEYAEKDSNQMKEIKDKENIFNATKEKQQIKYHRILIMLSTDFSAEILQAQRSGMIHLML